MGEDRYLVVSCDSHVGPSVRHQLREYCPAAHLEDFDRYVDDMEANQTPDKAIHIDLPEEHLERMARHGSVAGLQDPHALLADMDSDGTAANVIFHGGVNGQAIPFSSFGLVTWETQKYRHLDSVGYRIYNRWLADFVSVAPERLVGVAHIPIYDVDAAVAEVEWAAANGFKTINLPGQRPDIPGYNEPAWEPLWTACEANDMVLSTHGGGGQIFPYRGVEGPAIFQCEVTFFGRRATWFLVFGGVFERHPRLKFIVTEQFGDWVVETLADMDSAYLAPQQTSLRKILPKMPREYWMSNCYVGASFMSRREAEVAHLNGLAGKLCWGSDYPHHEGTWPRTRLSQRNTFSGLPEDSVRRLIGLNGAEVYGLEVDKLQAIADRIGPTPEELATPLAEPYDGYLGCAFREIGKWA